MCSNIRKFTFDENERFTLPAEREAFSALRDWLQIITGELGLESKVKKQLLVAADEIFTNIVSYGYPSGEGKIEVSVEADMDIPELIITFYDYGIPYNPIDAKPPDIESPLAERELGGLGIFMVKKLMDQIEYQRIDNCNILVLKKRFKIAEKA